MPTPFIHGWPAKIIASLPLPAGGNFHWRRDGEQHDWNPWSVAKLQEAARTGDRSAYKAFSESIAELEANVVAAVDVFDTGKTEINRHVLRYATSLLEVLGGELHVVNALPLSRSIVLERHSPSYYDRMLTEIAGERRRLIDNLLEDTDVHGAEVHVIEGTPYKVVSQFVDNVHAEFLVIGKVKPSVSAFLGTTSEQLLHTVNSDVVTVP